MPVFDEELHGDLCFGSFCPHYTVLNKPLAPGGTPLYDIAVRRGESRVSGARRLGAV